MSVQFLKKYARTIGHVVGILGAVTVYGFLLLVTSISFHWWHPFWGVRTGRAVLVALVILCVFYSLLYALRLWLKARAYQKRGYDYSILQQLIVATEVFAGFVLCAVWGLLVLADELAVLPLELLAMVWIIGFVCLVALQVHELRRKRRRGLR